MSLSKSIALAGLSALFATTAFAATIHKDPRCGCCAMYATYMRDQSYDIEVEDSFEVVPMSVAAGIPSEVQGCHLMMIEGYAVSGHVPAEAIEKLLSERPEIVGLTLPGMPMGSPGMGGNQQEPFDVLALPTDGGEASIFMSL